MTQAALGGEAAPVEPTFMGLQLHNDASSSSSIQSTPTAHGPAFVSNKGRKVVSQSGSALVYAPLRFRTSFWYLNLQAGILTHASLVDVVKVELVLVPNWVKLVQPQPAELRFWFHLFPPPEIVEMKM